MKSTVRYLRMLLRRLGRAPLFTVVTILTLGIGIGANSAIFSVVNGVLLKPLPYEDPERLVGVWHTAPGLGFDRINQSPSLHFTYKKENRVFEDLGMWDNATVSITGLHEPERIVALMMTYETLPVLRIRPLLGHTFTAEEDSPKGPDTVILTYRYWRQRFGGDSGIVGGKLIVDGKIHQIIGVLPQSFRFLRYDPAVILPFRFDPAAVMLGNFSYQGVARLKPGVTLEEANADVARMIPLSYDRYPMPGGLSKKMLEDAKIGPRITPFKEDAVGDVGSVLWVLFGTAGLILLIACANVANLFLVRAEGRQQELAIRSALGAGWRKIARDLLAESVVLGLMGGVLGLALAYGGTRLLLALGPESVPRLEEITIDPLVLLFTLGISILGGMLFGLVSILKYARPHVASALREGGRTNSAGRERHRTRNVLVVSQVALALVLLVGCGLMIRTFQAMRKVQPGFTDPAHAMTLRISVPEVEVPDIEQTIRTHEQIVRRIEEVPGVESVGLSSSITMDGHDSNDPIFVEDKPLPEGQLPPIRRLKWVTPNYFRTMGNPLLAGRDVSWTDIYNTAPVAVVTENFARKYWDSPAAAIGRRIRTSPTSPWRRIIGVVGDVRDDGVNREAVPVVYWPALMKDYWQEGLTGRRSLSYVIRSQRTGSPAFMKEIRQAVWSVNRNLPLADVRSLDELLQESLARTSFTLIMLAIAAIVALLLGSVGIYGVISYTASQRTREIGIRMALGAQRSEVSRIFVRHAVVLTGIGVAIGLFAAGAVTRLMSSLLYGVNAIDPLTYVLVAVGLGLIALLAAYVPARRASGVDPVEALRWE